MYRSKDTYSKSVYEFVKDILIVCPKCSQKALIHTANVGFCNSESDIKLICEHCGYNKRFSEVPENNHQFISRMFVIGGSIDPFFHQELWLTQNCGENILWAYNYDHLIFLEKHVQAKLRERNTTNDMNKSLGSRLPKWMTSKKNRAVVIKAIEFLKTK